MLIEGTRRKWRAERRLGPAQRQRLRVQKHLLENHGRLDPAPAEPQPLLFVLTGVFTQVGPQPDRFVEREGSAYAAVWPRRLLLPRLADRFECILHNDRSLALGSFEPQADGLAHRIDAFDVLQRLGTVEVKDQPVVLAIVDALQAVSFDN